MAIECLPLKTTTFEVDDKPQKLSLGGSIELDGSALLFMEGVKAGTNTFDIEVDPKVDWISSITYEAIVDQAGNIAGYEFVAQIQQYLGANRKPGDTEPLKDFSPRNADDVTIKLTIPELLPKPEFTYTFDIIQNAPMGNIDMGEAPQIPNTSVEEDEIEKSGKELEQNIKESLDFKKKISAMIDQVWMSIVKLGEEFIDAWKKKLYRILMKLDSQFASSQETIIRKIDAFVLKCAKLVSIAEKIKKEKLKPEGDQDKDMLSHWQSKIQDLQKDLEEEYDSIKEHFVIKDSSGYTELSSLIWKEDQQVTLDMCKTFRSNINNWVEEVFEDKASFLDRMYATFNVGNFGRILDEKFQTLKDQGLVVYNSIRDQVQTGFNAITEPVGAVITTPTGPGAEVSNLIQVRNTIKRVQAACAATVPAFGLMLDAAIFLKLPQKIILPILGAATILTTVSAIPVP